MCVWDESAAVQPSRQRVDDALEAVPGRWFGQEQGHFAVGQMTSLPVLTAEGNINAGGGPVERGRDGGGEHGRSSPGTTKPALR